MNDLPELRIAAANLLNTGLVLKFVDGRCAFYSCQLLHDSFPLADELDESDLEW